LATGLLAGCATLDEKQREWIFQPSDRTWSGGLAAAQGMDEVWIPFRSAETGQDVKLHGLWLPQARADAPVLLYLHGARWDVRGSAHRMRRMHALGFAVLGVDYRGFGQSTQALPSEDLAHEDARAAWQWLAQQQPKAPRYLFGHSLGGAIAVRLATEAPDLAGLMLEGSFTSIPDVVRHFKYGWLPVGPLITQRFDAASRIGQVKVPVLVVHGSADRLIPPALGQALYERAPQPKRFVLVEGGSHHNTNSLGQDQYRAAVASLFGLRMQTGQGERCGPPAAAANAGRRVGWPMPGAVMARRIRFATTPGWNRMPKAR
jgi:alpha-beta hydrolase superfamily lysophospholipase